MRNTSSEYNNLILTHYRYPRNFGILKKLTHKAAELNPLCGDEISVYLEIKNDRLKNIRYQARGCALSIAAASLLSEQIKGKKLAEIRKANQAMVAKLLQVKVNRGREPCTTLALKTIYKALKQKGITTI